MSRFTQIYTPYAPLLWLGLGAYLLLSAYQVPGFLDAKQSLFVVGALFYGWFFVLGYGAVRCARRGEKLSFLASLVAALAVFIWTIYPGEPQNQKLAVLQQMEKMFTLQLWGFTGAVLVFFGAVRAPWLHVWLEVLALLLARSLRFPRWLVLGVLALALVLLCVFLSHYIRLWQPVIVDSMAQYVHAKFMAIGDWYGKSHPLSQFFLTPMMLDNGKWYSQYQPLHVFLLSLGHHLHAPWLVNPLNAGLSVVLLYVLTRHIADEATARIAAALTVVCTFIITMSSEYMSHATALNTVIVFLICYIRTMDAIAAQKHRVVWALAAGLSLGAVFLVRPLVAVEVSGACIFYALYWCWRAQKTYLPTFAVMAVAGLICLGFQALYNAKTTGDPLLFPYMQYTMTNVPWFDREHTVWKGFIKAQDEWRRMNIALFEWRIPGLLFAFLACLPPLYNRHIPLLLAVLLVATIANGFNRFDSDIYGPRYIYELSSIIIVLTAMGICRLPELLRQLPIALPDRRVLQGALALLIITLSAASLTVVLPEKATRSAQHFAKSDQLLWKHIAPQVAVPALVFVDPAGGRGIPKKLPRYHVVGWMNPPQDDAPIIFARDLGEDNEKLIAHYKDRNAYLERHRVVYPIDKNTFRAALSMSGESDEFMTDDVESLLAPFEEEAAWRRSSRLPDVKVAPRR